MLSAARRIARFAADLHFAERVVVFGFLPACIPVLAFLFSMMRASVAPIVRNHRAAALVHGYLASLCAASPNRSLQLDCSFAPFFRRTTLLSVEICCDLRGTRIVVILSSPTRSPMRQAAGLAVLLVLASPAPHRRLRLCR